MREILFRGKHLDTGEWVFGDLYHRGKEAVITSFCAGHHVAVDPTTVCEFTGLLDKAGKRIFEGDIVSFGANVYVVKYIEKYSRFSGTMPGIVFSGFPLSNSIVIGNIHDNQDLMEGNTDA